MIPLKTSQEANLKSNKNNNFNVKKCIKDKQIEKSRKNMLILIYENIKFGLQMENK